MKYNVCEINKTGSVLLIMIVVMSVLSLFCLTAWYSSCLFHDISLERLTYEQHFRAAQGNLNYGIQLCSKKFDEIYKLLNNNKTFFIETDDCKISENKIYKCRLDISLSTINVTSKNNPKNLHLKSSLFNTDNIKLFELSCNIVKSNNQASLKKSNKLYIKNWNISSE